MNREKTLTAPIVHCMSIHALSIPFRTSVDHAAASRQTSDAIIVRLELMNGTEGFGETLPRTYVSGESPESVIRDLQASYATSVLEFHPQSFPDALEAIEALPWVDNAGRGTPAARAAVELALLDASMRYFNRTVDDVVQWLGLVGFGSPGSLASVRYTGVLAAVETSRTVRHLRKMYWGGLRGFKLKVGDKDDIERLERVARYLRAPIQAGRATLRVDANGQWTKDQAIDFVNIIREKGITLSGIEQPFSREHESDLPLLGDLTDVPLIHDESLVTMDDARRLVDLGVGHIFNIRLSKCGGLLPSLRIAAFARREGARFGLGCMVGETAILSAAGLRFLEAARGVEWAEGCFGTYLLKEDVVTRKLRFGYGGLPPRLKEPGLGVAVDVNQLRKLSQVQPITLRF